MSTSAAILRSYDNAALNKSQFISSVSGKKFTVKKSGKKIKAFSAAGFIIAMIVVFAILFGLGNIIPSGISERLIEEFDVQYADAVKSKELVFQQAMYQGKIPEDTEQLLKESGVETIRTESGEIALKMDDGIITASNFITEVSNNVKLYNAFTRATYSRAAYYYDDAAKKVFQRIGTNRNNYTSDSVFEKVMSAKVGSGSNVNVNSVSLVKKTRENEETGEVEEYYEYEENGPAANSNTPAGAFIDAVREKNPATSALESTFHSANALKIADTISKEERSSLFFVTFMENISKMKAGDGNESKINEAMNYLYEPATTEILDVKTGNMVTSSGTALESPSLYAVLAGGKMNASEVENYSSDRILKTIENQVGASAGGGTLLETVTSSLKMKGSIGRFISAGLEKASAALMNVVEPTVSSSLMNNSFETIKGVDRGEFLVEGAVNVGKELAKASGASAGDENAVVQYAKLNSSVVAMDAAADRLNRSPFDITSKNTFLGSIVYKLAINLGGARSLLSSFTTILNSTKSATLSLLPTTYADEEVTSYLSSFGDCETYGLIGAVGSAHCSEIATFDTSTLNDPFNDADFIAFVNNNTTMSESGERMVRKGSALEKYIIYNDERRTPLGVVDGGILESLKTGSSSISFIADILRMIKIFLTTTSTERRIASGATFVNSSSNPDWLTYKYAQRYISLSRAASALRSNTSDSSAYNNILYFEGDKDPIMAFLNEYYLLAEN